MYSLLCYLHDCTLKTRISLEDYQSRKCRHVNKKIVLPIGLKRGETRNLVNL